jgi:hypothetical protein
VSRRCGSAECRVGAAVESVAPTGLFFRNRSTVFPGIPPYSGIARFQKRQFHYSTQMPGLVGLVARGRSARDAGNWPASAHAGAPRGPARAARLRRLTRMHDFRFNVCRNSFSAGREVERSTKENARFPLQRL